MKADLSPSLPSMPAKLIPRRDGGIVPRERLFAALDAMAARPLSWVQGPAGSGKTTLVDGYADRLGAPTLWYRADEGDIDPASCFACLAQAAAACPGAQRAVLPAFTPLFVPELAAFTRRFLRLMFAALPSTCVLVFDELESAPGDTLAALLRVACDELPPGMRLLATSRHAPPPALAHLNAKGTMATLGWAELRLQAAEARAIATARVQAALPRTDELLALCDGWIAGFVVLLEAARQPGGAALQHAIDEHVFPYFVHEIFARTDAATQALLTRCAALGEFGAAEAGALCSEPRAAELLEGLCRDQGFVERTAAEPPYYRCHPLFRDFLLQRLERDVPPDERDAIAVQAARLLAAQGRAEQALPLLCRARAWGEAADLLCQLAPALLAQGRYVTLEQALAKLPAQMAPERPWLHYWQGMARMPASPLQARADLEAAYKGFARSGDLVACISACAAVLEATLFEGGPLHHLDRWGDTLRELLARAGPALPSDVAARALASVAVLVPRGVRHKDLADAALAKAVTMLTQLGPQQARFGAAALALLLINFKADWAAACRLARDVERWLEPAAMPPLPLTLWHAAAASAQLWNGDFEAAGGSLHAAFEVARANQLRVMDVVTEGVAVYCALAVGDFALARTHLGRARAALAPQRLIDAANVELLGAVVDLATGRTREGLAAARRAAEATAACGALSFMVQCRIVVAAAEVLAGELEAALASALSVDDFGREAGLHPACHSAMLLRAWAALRGGDETRALATLREALSFGRRRGLRVVFPWVPQPMLQELGVLALRHDAESDLVREMLRLHRVPAPGDAPPQWPWPLRVRCLGGFEIVVGDSVLQVGPKAPKKPLELLKAVIALGGSGVPLPALLQALWPDLDGDAAQNAFNVALHRLRKLVGSERALVVSEGRVSIDSQRVWTDVAELRRHTAAIDGGRPRDAGEAARELLAIYRGPFLDGDDAPWAAACHDCLRSRALRACTRLAGQLEDEQRWSAALELHRRVVEVEPAAETFHRGLMRCLAAVDCHAEAFDVYRRCERALRLHTGAQPSAQTRELAQRCAGAAVGDR